ncbi:MAG: winged helix-turn-helix transcriptional regulator [Thermodesulfobacteriota bacterium]
MGIENQGIFKPSEEIRDLRVLEELERNPIISQRELSHKFNIALGVTNACLKRMVRRGWIQVRGLSHRRVGYYLTPKGFAEKAKLSVQMISFTIQHYAELKKVISQRFLEMEQNGLKRIVFYGISDETEVAYITLQGVDLKLVGIIEDDEKFRPQILLGYEVEPVSRVKELKPDCILITCLEKIEEKKQRIRKFLNDEDVYLCDISLK